MTDQSAAQRRLSVNLSTAADEALTHVCAAQQISATEGTRRAISLLAYHQKEVVEQGGKWLIETSDGRVKEVLFPF